MLRRCVAALVLCLGFAGISQASEITIPGSVVATEIQKALRGTVIRLDRNRPKKPGGLIQFGPGVGYERIEFETPVHKISLGIAGQINYEVRDLWMTGFKVRATPERFHLEATFDSLGTELKGWHSVLGDLAVPDLQMDNGRLQAFLVPTIDEKGRPTYGKTTLSMTADLLADAWSIVVSGKRVDLLEELTGYQNKVLSAVEQELRKGLESPDRKAELGRRLADAMGARAKAMGMNLKSMTFRGTALVLTLEPQNRS